MKEIKLFVQKTCPHCMKCMTMVDELLDEHSEYKDVPITIIDERLDPVTADKYDYYYVPTFFVGDVKVHEGVPTRDAVDNVFTLACEE